MCTGYSTLELTCGDVYSTVLLYLLELQNDYITKRTRRQVQAYIVETCQTCVYICLSLSCCDQCPINDVFGEFGSIALLSHIHKVLALSKFALLKCEIEVIPRPPALRNFNLRGPAGPGNPC